jgi:hypothetical protein
VSAPEPLESPGDALEVDLEALHRTTVALRKAMAEFGIRFAEAMSKVDWAGLRLRLEALQSEDSSE